MYLYVLLKPPKYFISNFIEYFKDKIVIMIFKRHGNSKYKFGNINSWSCKYNKAKCCNYPKVYMRIRQDGLNVRFVKKEYVDTFNSSA